MSRKDVEVFLKELAAGFEEMPILFRLEYAKALVVNRAGKTPDKRGEPELNAAIEIIEAALVDLRETIPRELLTEYVGRSTFSAPRT